MPDYAQWALIISLAMLAFGLTLEIVKIRSAYNKVNKSRSKILRKLAVLKKQNNQAIPIDFESSENQIEKFMDEFGRQVDHLMSEAAKAREPGRAIEQLEKDLDYLSQQ